MRLLFASHCTPNPPNKGEKIRSHNILTRLGRRHEVHLACFARDESELESAREMEQYCASVHAELLDSRVALAKAAVPFLLGQCLNMRFYHSASFARYIQTLCGRVAFDSAIAYSLPLAPYIPANIPCLLDMQDVDSEKWFQYAETRMPSFLYRLEARRLRQQEIQYARAARSTIFVTQAEERLFRDFCGDVRTGYVENGADLAFYDPASTAPLSELAGRRFVVFVGTMDYYPNAEAVLYFSRDIFPLMREKDPALEFFIVGRRPPPEVRALGSQPGITVTGTVADPRPYLVGCQAVVAPLRLARGCQLKVLEGLAMGRPVLASPAIARTFGGSVPYGVLLCETAAQYWQALLQAAQLDSAAIRDAIRQRCDWDRNVVNLENELLTILGPTR